MSEVAFDSLLASLSTAKDSADGTTAGAEETLGTDSGAGSFAPALVPTHAHASHVFPPTQQPAGAALERCAEDLPPAEEASSSATSLPSAGMACTRYVHPDASPVAPSALLPDSPSAARLPSADDQPRLGAMDASAVGSLAVPMGGSERTVSAALRIQRHDSVVVQAHELGGKVYPSSSLPGISFPPLSRSAASVGDRTGSSVSAENAPLALEIPQPAQSTRGASLPAAQALTQRGTLGAPCETEMALGLALPEVEDRPSAGSVAGLQDRTDASRTIQEHQTAFGRPSLMMGSPDPSGATRVVLVRGSAGSSEAPSASPRDTVMPGIDSDSARQALHERLVEAVRESLALAQPRRVDVTLASPRGALIVVHISRGSGGEIRAQLASDSAAVLAWLGHEIAALRRGEPNGVVWLPPQPELLPSREARAANRSSSRRTPAAERTAVIAPDPIR